MSRLKQGKYKAWYGGREWQNIRKHQLMVEPLCRMHAHKGQLVGASVVDHVVPHNGDYNRFLLGEVQSLCKDCHDRHKRMVDLHGFFTAADEHGWPIDPNHPTNVRERSRPPPIDTD